MCTTGEAEQALEVIIHRAHNRAAFGKLLADQAMIRQAVAEARIEIA